jgi:hypothetical protein
MEREKILVGGDWNAHSDRWNPRCQPRNDVTFVENLMNEYGLVGVADQEATWFGNRNGEAPASLIDIFTTKAAMAD